MNGFARVAAMLALCGAMAGFAVSLFVPHRYQSNASFIFVSPYDADAQTLFDRVSEVTLMNQSLELMIRRSPYFKNRLYVETIADLVAETRSTLNLKSARIANQAGATITFEDDDSDTALDVTSVLLSEFGNNAARVVSAKKASDVVKIVQTPNVRLTGLTPWLLTAMGFAAGLLAALFIWILLPKKR